jgi:hypothetical protein
MSKLTREEFEAVWENWDEHGRATKEPQLATLSFISYYRRLDADDRHTANEAVFDWVSDDDGGKRYVAHAIIRKFKLSEAAPYLESRLADLEGEPGPVERDEREWLKRLLAGLK